MHNLVHAPLKCSVHASYPNVGRMACNVYPYPDIISVAVATREIVCIHKSLLYPNTVHVQETLRFPDSMTGQEKFRAFHTLGGNLVHSTFLLVYIGVGFLNSNTLPQNSVVGG